MGISSFRTRWAFARGLTLDLLDSLAPEALSYTPGQGVGPFWKQFRHVGRVQENYVEALVTGHVSFHVTDTYQAGSSSESLSRYLRSMDDRMEDRLASLDDDGQVGWDDGSISVDDHLHRLFAHETLHHGQWVVYVKLMGGSFPASWAAWGL